MPPKITLNINGQTHHLAVHPDTPLLYVLRNDLGLSAPKYGCGLEQCNTCKILIDGAAVPSCQLPVGHVEGLSITTLEGLSPTDELHPLQEAFLHEQAAQCGFCTAGMIVAAQGLLNRTRYPSNDEIREALNDNLCRCGVYDRIRRAIKLRIGRLEDPIYEVRDMPLEQPDTLAGLPTSIAKTPALDRWLRINTDGTITAFSGKVEIGQGINTAAIQIVADELDVASERIQLVAGNTDLTPDEGLTAGSMSIEMTGNALHYAAAEARFGLLELAFEELEAQSIEELQINDGVITDPTSGRSVSYWELMGGKSFGREISGTHPPKAPVDFSLIGQSQERVDLLSKVTGGKSYVHDMTLPNMLHARVLHPPTYSVRLVFG